jgi:membrane-associated phospholipid phosphatase
MSMEALLGIEFWHLITRLGEMQILLPAAALALVSLFWKPDARRLAWFWVLLLVSSTLITTASKVAFIGWGIGISAIDFTGFSGHAMFASAVYPLLFTTLASHAHRGVQRLALAGGFVLAVLVGISRVEVGAHSWSEVLAGLLLGGAVSVAALAQSSLPRAAMGRLAPVLVAVWLLIMPIHAPQTQSHSLVTRLSLTLSGKLAPHTRHDLLKDLGRS